MTTSYFNLQIIVYCSKNKKLKKRNAVLMLLLNTKTDFKILSQLPLAQLILHVAGQAINLLLIGTDLFGRTMSFQIVTRQVVSALVVIVGVAVSLVTELDHTG